MLTAHALLAVVAEAGCYLQAFLHAAKVLEISLSLGGRGEWQQHSRRLVCWVLVRADKGEDRLHACCQLKRAASLDKVAEAVS